MRIIELQALSNGAHRNQRSSTPLPIPDGWAIIPEDMVLPESFPFVDIEEELDEEKRTHMVTKLTGREVPQESNKREHAERITELKQLLAETDYAVIKIAEGVATKEEYAEIIAQRQAWREEIRALEGEAV